MKIVYIDFPTGKETPIPASLLSERDLTKKADLIKKKARALQRKGWYDRNGRHVEWNNEAALLFAFNDLSGLHASRYKNKLRFADWRRHCPDSERADWVAAYRKIVQS